MAPPALFSSDPATVRKALRQLDHGALVRVLGVNLDRALAGSHDAVHQYVLSYQALAQRVLDEASGVRPDLIRRRADGRLAVVDVKGTPRRAPIEALETASSEAPFGPWTAEFPLADAVALDLTSRVCVLIGVRPPTPAGGGSGVGTSVDDATALRFLRRVRACLNRLDETPLERVMGALELSKTELGQLFDVSRQAVDQWLTRGVPADRQEKLQTVLAVCELLERKLKPGRLGGVARRPAKAYGGMTILEMIAADRHRELLESVRASFDWSTAA
jgi:hypothetical protein